MSKVYFKSFSLFRCSSKVGTSEDVVLRILVVFMLIIIATVVYDDHSVLSWSTLLSQSKCDIKHDIRYIRNALLPQESADLE